MVPQGNIFLGSAQLLYKLLKAISLDNGAAIRQAPFECSNPKLRFYRFTNTESPELLQFFLPEMEGLTQLRNTSPDAFDQDSGGCDLAPVYEALRKRFDAYWKDCMEWVEGNLAYSKAVQDYWRNEEKLPASKDQLDDGLFKYKRTGVKVRNLNNIFSQDPSVRSFMNADRGGTIILDDATKARQEGKDEIAAIVSITMIWLAQLGASDAGCTIFRGLLYEKIRLLFLEDDPEILEGQIFREIANVAYQNALVENHGQSGSVSKDDSMVEQLFRNSPVSYLQIMKNLMLNLTNHADVSSDDVKQMTLRYEEM